MYHRRQILRKGRGLTESVRKRSVGLRRVERRERWAGPGAPSWPWPSRVPVLGAVQLFLCCADSDETRNIEKISGKPKRKGKIPRALSLVSTLYDAFSSLGGRARPRVSPWSAQMQNSPDPASAFPVGPCSLPVQAPPVASVPVSRARSSGVKFLAYQAQPNDRLLLSYSTYPYSYTRPYMCVYLHTYCYYSTCPLTDLLVGYCACLLLPKT